MSQDALTQARWEDRWVRSEPNYDPAADEQLRDSLSLILRYWPDCRGHFLEAGCGSAANALNLAQRGVEVSGVDLSPEAVRVASQAFEARALRGDFRVADVRDLPFPDDSFEFVYAGGVVEHFLETGQAVAEMARVLRPRWQSASHGPCADTELSVSLSPRKRSGRTGRRAAHSVHPVPIASGRARSVWIRTLLPPLDSAQPAPSTRSRRCVRRPVRHLSAPASGSAATQAVRSTAGTNESLCADVLRNRDTLCRVASAAWWSCI
jgi:SAM-dependent methyltransferase